ncbi:MAG: hypothetical protein AAB446_01425 [Patescibacteria group bacterium]
MTTTIVVFASSLFLLAVFVAIKAVEVKYEKRNLLLCLLGKCDTKSEKLVSDFKFKTLQIIQSVRYIVLVQVKEVCKTLLENVEEKIVNEYRARHMMIMGHKEIANKGSVSFYLKKINEGKTLSGRGKIEEVL